MTSVPLECPNGHRWAAPARPADTLPDRPVACPVCGSPGTLVTADGPRSPDTPRTPLIPEPASFTQPPSPGPPQRVAISLPAIGGYAVQSVLGRGGMGVVYKARQLSLGRDVAVKMLVEGEHASPDSVARFQAEAEAVARLRHPNIVQVYEVGRVEDRPFFAMEYVEGINLARKIAGTPQPPRPSAELLATLARAMHHAHQQGIVHRDLKPANVLLVGNGEWGVGNEKRDSKSSLPTPHSPFPIPKVTDFGLAKRLEVATPLTRTGEIMGTPSYMAPEQAGGAVKQVGPAVDIYALGAILYEMLTGRPPFLADNPVDIVLRVLSEEPVPPRRLQPKVPRDLETVCLKCLEKNPRQRYPSAEALAEDLERFLAGRPTLARPVGPVGRAAKWAKRQPALAALVAVSVAAFLAVLAGALMLRGKNAELRDANDRLTEALGKEERQRQRNVTQLRVVLQSLEGYALAVDERLAELPQTEQLRPELLDTLLKKFEPFLELEPTDPELRRLRLQAARDVGRLQQALGRFAEAGRMTDEAVAGFEKLREEFPDNAEYKEGLAKAYLQHASLLQATGKIPEAERRFRDALKLLEALVAYHADEAGYRQTLAMGYSNFAPLLRRTGRTDEAREVLEAALDVRRQLLQAEPANDQYKWELAATYNNLVSPYLALGRTEQALQALAKGLEQLKAIGPPLAMRGDYRKLLAGNYLNTGLLLQHRDPARAAAAFGEALALWDKLRTDFPTVAEFRKRTADTHSSIGVLAHLGGRPSEADAAFRQALRLREDLVRDFPGRPEQEFDLGKTLYYLGQTSAAAGHFEEAELLWGREADVFRALVGRAPGTAIYHNYLGSVCGQLAGLRWAKGRGAAAASLLSLGAWGSPWDRIARAQADFLACRARFTEAAGLYREGIAQLRRARQAEPANPVHAEELQEPASGLARVAEALGQHADLADAAEGLVEAAEGQPKLAPDLGKEYRRAAGRLARCVALARADGALSANERADRVRHYAGRAVELLRKAAAKGQRDAADLRRAPDLEPLRTLPDFQRLVEELEGRARP